MNIKKQLSIAIEASIEAGKEIIKVYETNDFQEEKKADNSPLTLADRNAHNKILSFLEKTDIPILSEEGQHLPYEERKKWNYFWLVDPLDGTKEFIKRRDSFTVNIALIHKNKSILGVVYAPAFGVSYYACRGHGSFKETKKGSAAELQKIQARPLAKPAIFASSRSHPGKELATFLDNFKNDKGKYDLISMGSSLKMCLVAEGKADLYPRLWLTSEWDTAAAHCIVDEAGGKLVKTDMSPLLYNTKDSLLNPYFFAIGANNIDWVKYLPKQ